MNFRTGTFDRSRVVSVLRHFCPISAVDRLEDVDVESLWEQGKRLILLDVDNTLVEWRGEKFSEGVLGWLAAARARGLELCILSNTRNPTRLIRLADQLKIHVMSGRFKPSRAMFMQALAKFQVTSAQAVMIGDQLFTDILGSNRSGIDAIWIRQLSHREFGGTKISRFGEKLVRGHLYRALHAPASELVPDPIAERDKPIFDRSLYKQFVKFCFVGGTSFAIDLAVRWILMFVIRWNGDLMSFSAGTWLQTSVPAVFGAAHKPGDAFFPVTATIAGSLALLNSFVWNRAWTFQIRGKHERNEQLRRFLVVAILGIGLNVGLSTIFNHVLPGTGQRRALFATVLATAIGAVWNFGGQRLYAFRKKVA